jgi:hypothetical protein
MVCARVGEGKPRRARDPGTLGTKAAETLDDILLFEPEFIEAAIELGQQDGQAILRRPPLWKDKHFPDDVAPGGTRTSGPTRAPAR